MEAKEEGDSASSFKDEEGEDEMSDEAEDEQEEQAAVKL